MKEGNQGWTAPCPVYKKFQKSHCRPRLSDDLRRWIFQCKEVRSSRGFFCGEDLGKTLGWGRGVGGVKEIDGE